MEEFEMEDFEDEEYLGAYMIDEPEDLTLIMMPKLEIDVEKEIDNWAKILRRCKNKAELKEGLIQFYAYVSQIVLLQEEIRQLQTKAKELEFNIKMIQS